MVKRKVLTRKREEIREAARERTGELSIPEVMEAFDKIEKCARKGDITGAKEEYKTAEWCLSLLLDCAARAEYALLVTKINIIIILLGEFYREVVGMMPPERIYDFEEAKTNKVIPFPRLKAFLRKRYL